MPNDSSQKAMHKQDDDLESRKEWQVTRWQVDWAEWKLGTRKTKEREYIRTLIVYLAGSECWSSAVVIRQPGRIMLPSAWSSDWSTIYILFHHTQKYWENLINCKSDNVIFSGAHRGKGIPPGTRKSVIEKWCYSSNLTLFFA